MGAESNIFLEGSDVAVRITEKYALEVLAADRSVIWSTSQKLWPTVVIKDKGAAPLFAARKKHLRPIKEQSFVGYRLQLSGFDQADVEIEIIWAIDPRTDELLVQIEQIGGTDVVCGIDHLYRFEKRVTAGGYMVLPHGSGYLIPADCPDELPATIQDGNNLVGARWTLPFFGMVNEYGSLFLIVDTWWDCEVEATHRPDEYSALDLRWVSSLGTLAYPRRFVVRFAREMGYVQMAKHYRQIAKSQDLLRTLDEKARTTPALRKYTQNILVRWPAWNPHDADAVLDDLRKFRKMGFGINVFFPKWSERGYDSDKNIHCGWQGYLHPNPLAKGWQRLVDFSEELRRMDCLIQGFINPTYYVPQGPQYDASLHPIDSQGKRVPKQITTYRAKERAQQCLEHIASKGLHFDALYYDCYSCYESPIEDFSAAHRVTRRDAYELQNECFAETRWHGLIPGGEVARFWCIGQCDFFFFTDWSRDRLTNVMSRDAGDLIGVPIPLFQLVFHDCYVAGFSGGGYAYYIGGGADWWPHRSPRLYEMMFASAPAYNWLPNSNLPVQDWDGEKAKNKFDWLKRWSSYYHTIACSEMISHQFLSDDYQKQQIEFANGVTVQIDVKDNLCRVKAVDAFSGDWEAPAGDFGCYPITRDSGERRLSSICALG